MIEDLGIQASLKSMLKFVIMPILLNILFAFCSFALSPEEVFRRASPNIVAIYGLDDKSNPISQGSGVIISSNQVVTNCHVIKNSSRFLVHQGEKNYSAFLMFSNLDWDLCQLEAIGLSGGKLEKVYSNKLKEGQKVFAIGAPKGLELSITEGIISALRPYQGVKLVQTDAAISPGSSGGGLFNQEGKLVGITTFYVDGGQNLNFALPVEWVDEISKKKADQGANYGESGLTWLRKAVLFEEKKDWQGLLDHARSWTKKNPRSSQAWYWLGWALAHNKQEEQAIQAYREALHINPDNINAWEKLGWHYLTLFADNTEKNEKAIHAFKEALRIEPENAKNWSNLAFVYSNSKEYDQAIKAYREALRINPNDEKSWEFLGYAYEAVNQNDLAIQALREVVRINPDNAEGWFTLGLRHFILNQNIQAIKAYREAIRIKPDNVGYWLLLGRAYANINQYDQAIKAAHEVLRIDPRSEQGWLSLGWNYVNNGQKDKAIEAYKTLRSLNPDTAKILFDYIYRP